MSKKLKVKPEQVSASKEDNQLFITPEEVSATPEDNTFNPRSEEIRAVPGQLLTTEVVSLQVVHHAMHLPLH